MRFGVTGARPKAYLQAALHADEIPALLVLNHLQRLLRRAEAENRMRGEVVLVPVANPIGLNQFFLNYHIGRFELNSGQNFNRGHPDIFHAVKADVEDMLCDDADRNADIIRRSMRRQADALPGQTTIDDLRRQLFRVSVDADFILDLHCDNDALLHLYVGTPNWPGAADLAAELGSRATLLADHSGGHPFDEAAASVWWRLAEAFPERPVPPACLAATIELRGESDVSEDQAANDADALYRFLQRRGLIAGGEDLAPAADPEPATPLAAVEMVRNPESGIVAFERRPGDRVRAGDRIAVLVDPENPDFDAARTAIIARTSGLLFARVAKRFLPANQVIAKIAGTEPLPDRVPGQLMTD